MLQSLDLRIIAGEEQRAILEHKLSIVVCHLNHSSDNLMVIFSSLMIRHDFKYRTDITQSISDRCVFEEKLR